MLSSVLLYTRRNEHADVITHSIRLPDIALGHSTVADSRCPRIVRSAAHFATVREQLGFSGNWDNSGLASKMKSPICDAFVN